MKKKIIITAGPTLEYIDRVRYVSNISSGKTATILAKILCRKYEVTLVISKNSKYIPKSKKIKILYFDTFKSLNKILKDKLRSNLYDTLIHLAAVSDYTPYMLITESGRKIKLPSKTKISTEQDFLIKFKKNFKLIKKIKDYSKNKKIKIIAFKLTSNASDNQIRKSVVKLATEWVIHNDISEISEKKHIFNVWKNGQKIRRIKGAHNLAKFLEKII
ncbi:MAG: phosphopantothenoylcysteine decarboxylase [Elusimicrobiales bacterium]